ncbi:hypothetical protein C9216_26240 (plasmid) [Escherichia coli]|nr:hypothetical protein [Escherichia coli]TJE56149.1 hypothetical protein C9216_26240 [Escherichia coli]
MAFFYVHYVLIYQTVTSLTYVFVPLDFRPLNLQSTREELRGLLWISPERFCHFGQHHEQRTHF